MSLNIYLIRHGETDWNKELRLQGREDIALNERGRQQAHRCGEGIEALKVDLIVSSPLQRAKETAKIIGDCLGLNHVTLDSDIIERDFGEASGMTYEEKNKKYENQKIPGFEETDALLTRMLRAIKKYQMEYPDGNVLMVSHGGIINAILSFITKGKLGTGKTRLKNACINILEVVGDQINLVDYNLEAEEFAHKYLTQTGLEEAANQ